jgi:phosphate transport system protein
MSAAPQILPDAQSLYAGILERTLRAYLLAQRAAAAVADGLGNGDLEECWCTVNDAERQLDRLDSEVDLAVTSCIAYVTAEQARELLTCMKIVLDVERIGDLLSSVANCAHALEERIESDDLSDLVKMSTVLEKMLTDLHGTFLARNVELALSVLRTDPEIDRLRDLMMLRHLEQAQIRMAQDSIQVLFMAQSLERAGDHAKNVAEEICQLATGHPLRHALRCNEMPPAQMYLRWLKSQPEEKRSGA